MRKVLRGIIGAVIVLVGLVGLATALWAAHALQERAETLEKQVVSGMDLGLEGLEVMTDTLVILAQVVDDTIVTLDAVQVSAQSSADTLRTLQPVIQEMNDIVTRDLPENIEAIQDAMPAVEQASSTIDQALRTLAGFEWSATIPLVNYEINLGLGVDYDPPVPLDESVAQVSEALEALPGHLAAIEDDLVQTHQSLGETADSIEQVGEELAVVSGDLQDSSEVLEAYTALLSRTTKALRQVRWNIRQQIDQTRIALTAVLIWLALSQLAPLYLGCTLLFSSSSSAIEEKSPAGEPTAEP